MPYEIKIDVDADLAFETWTGTLTVPDVLECIEQRHDHPDYLESTPRLVDLSAAEGGLSIGEIHRLAMLHSLSQYRGRCAFVISTDKQHRLGTAFAAIVTGDRVVAVFRSKERALRWLGESGAQAGDTP